MSAQQNATSARKKRTPGSLSLLPVLGLLLVYFLMRTQALSNFPPFIDETNHLQFAQETLIGHVLAGARDSKLIVPWWLALFQPVGHSQLWIARVATILFSMVGLAGVYNLARQLSSQLAGMLAMAVLILIPYSTFFERLLLMDQYMVTFAILAIIFSTRLLKRVRFVDAVMCGLCLAGAMAAKGTGIALLCIPLPAVLFLPANVSWRRRLKWLAFALGTFAIIWGPLFVFLRSRQLNYFSIAATIADLPVMNDMPGRLVANFAGFPQADAIYFSPVFLGLVCAGTIYLLVRYWRIGLFFLLSAALPTFGILAISPILRPRYVLLHVPIIVAAFAIAVGYLYDDLRQQVAVRVVALSGIMLATIVWAVGFALPFQWAIWHDPAQVTVPDADRFEYVAADSSGFALDKIATFLLTQAARNPQQLDVVGLISNCHGLALVMPENTNVTLECPVLHWRGGGGEVVTAFVNQRATASNRDVWIITENIPYAGLDGVTATLAKVVTFDRPDGFSHLTLYHVVRSTDVF